MLHRRSFPIDSYSSSVARGISVLSSLQTLKVDALESLEILEHLPQLRHLQFKTLDDENSTDSFEISPHENLQFLSHIAIDDLTYLLEKISSLKKTGTDAVGRSDSALDLTCFQKLKSLTFSFHNSYLTLPQSMKRLKLDNCKLSQTLLNEIRNLPGLEVLKLNWCDFENETCEPSEGEFCQIQYLEICVSNLENWSAAEIHYPVLRDLVIKECHDLTEIPNDIGGIETLETIELDECQAEVFDSARTILKEQLEFGKLSSNFDSASRMFGIGRLCKDDTRS